MEGSRSGKTRQRKLTAFVKAGFMAASRELSAELSQCQKRLLFRIGQSSGFCQEWSQCFNQLDGAAANLADALFRADATGIVSIVEFGDQIHVAVAQTATSQHPLPLRSAQLAGRDIKARNR